jgi:Uma2 family endonuclease
MTTKPARDEPGTEAWLPTDLDLPPSVESAAHIRLPTDLDLPYDDDTPMDSDRHAAQIELLKECLRLAWAGRDFFIGGNMFVYFNRDQIRTRDFRGPDVFVVLDVPQRERRGWVVWDEGKAPDVVIELLSDTTAAVDRGEKKLVYQDRLRTPEYYWYHPFTSEFAGWLLLDGVYVPIAPDDAGRFISPRLGLALRIWEGQYAGITAPWLRWATLEDELLPTGEEYAEQERVRAEQERIRAERERQRAEQMERRLADQGVLLEEALRRVTELETRLRALESGAGEPSS